MAAKLAFVLLTFCLLYTLLKVQGSIVKPNNIPRIGRSDENAGSYDQDAMGYVIKTNKNIPRMGRRNYDSGNHFDIPKFYQMPGENYVQYENDHQTEFNQEEAYPFADQYGHLMKK